MIKLPGLFRRAFAQARPAPGWQSEVALHAESLVRAAYRSLLSREAEPAGLAHWVEFLQRGGAYNQLLQSFIESAEYRRLRQARVKPVPPEKLEHAEPGLRTTDLRLAVLGNCQMGHLARCLQALVGGPMPLHQWLTPQRLAALVDGSENIEPIFAAHDKVFLQPWIWEPIAARYAHHQQKVVLYPEVGFMAYHPDLVPVLIRDSGEPFEKGPCIRCNSSVAFLGWKAGLSVDQTLALFNRDTFRKLGFFDYWDSSVAALMKEGQRANLPLDALLEQWRRGRCFVHDHVHPKLFVYADIARLLLERLGVPTLPGDPIQYVHDYLANGIIWPVYPEIAQALGCEGSYVFKLLTPGYKPDKPVNLLGLTEMVERSFAAYAAEAEDSLFCPRLDLPEYQSLLAELKQSAAPALMALPTAAASSSTPPSPPPSATHPYRDLSPPHFWRSAVAQTLPAQLDPVIKPRVRIEPGTRVAAAGSCFAQHIARRLEQAGFNFLRTETSVSSPGTADGDDDAYSARYGNLYTARQLRQLIERAYGEFHPQERAWRRADGRYADPFRPGIARNGFASVEALDAARSEHLAAVRRLFETLDVFIFTLGLTEAWRAKADGAVFPLAPGVSAGEMDRDRYEFVNFSEIEVADDVEAFVAHLRRVNPQARLIFTVSPVPLAATYSDRHALVANAYSKAVLRVAVERVISRLEGCDYFPSYEIVTGSFNRGAYYDEDLRHVSAAGVDHVMNVFFRHYARSGRPAEVNPRLLAEIEQATHVICDEELLAAAVVS